MALQSDQGARSLIYPWRDASLCESRGPTGEFCPEPAGHDGAHHVLKGAGSVSWFKDYPYWNGQRWVRPAAFDETQRSTGGDDGR